MTYRSPRAGAVSALALAAAVVLGLPGGSARAQTLFDDATTASGLGGFVPTVNRDASPAAFPAFFKALGEALGAPLCGAGTDSPTCMFGQSAYIGGAVIADFNNDGLNDLFATNADDGANGLFINTGIVDGVPQFVDMAAEMGAAFPRHQASAAVAGDVNNDGYVDLYISNIGFDPAIEYARTSPAFAVLGALSEADLEIASTSTRGLNLLLINQGFDADDNWLGFAQGGGRIVRGEPSTRSVTPSFVDFDNDGDLDIFVAAHRNVFMVPVPTNFPAWTDAGPGTLSKRVADIACFGDDDAEPGVLGDGIDSDGSCVAAGGNLLFRNMLVETGNLRFRDVTRLLRNAVDSLTGERNRGVDGRPYIDSHMAFDPVWFDYDGDGDADLFIANDADFIGVYRNDVDVTGRFTLVSRTALIDPGKFPFQTPGGPVDVGAVGAWMGISHGDVNGDGLLDFYATNAGDGDLGGTAFTQPLHALYINLGDGRFVDVAARVDRDASFTPPASLGHPAMDDLLGGIAETAPGHFAFGGQMFDMDNDRDLDIFNIGNLFGSGVGTRAADANGGDLAQNGSEVFRVTNRGTLYENLGRNRRLQFDGVSGRVEVPVMDHLTETATGRAATGLDNPFDGRGLAIGDLNNDGYPDVVVYNVSGNATDNFNPDAMPIGSYNGGLRLFLNAQGDGSNRALALRLRGTESNASGIGARVEVKGGGRPVVREFSSNAGHRGNASLEMLIGVGRAQTVNVVIDWPSGIRQHLLRVPLDASTRTCYEVVETRGAPRLASRNMGVSLLPCAGDGMGAQQSAALANDG